MSCDCGCETCAAEITQLQTDASDLQFIIDDLKGERVSLTDTVEIRDDQITALEEDVANAESTTKEKESIIEDIYDLARGEF